MRQVTAPRPTANSIQNRNAILCHTRANHSGFPDEFIIRERWIIRQSEQRLARPTERETLRLIRSTQTVSRAFGRQYLFLEVRLWHSAVLKTVPGFLFHNPFSADAFERDKQVRLWNRKGLGQEPRTNRKERIEAWECLSTRRAMTMGQRDARYLSGSNPFFRSISRSLRPRMRMIMKK
jgi:hypothetical protein